METILPPFLPGPPHTRRKLPDLVKDDILLRCAADQDAAASLPSFPAVPDWLTDVAFMGGRA